MSITTFANQIQRVILRVKSLVCFYSKFSNILFHLFFSGKGGKNRRRGKNENETEIRELVFKEDGQEYAQVLKMLGNGRLDAMCFDGIKRLCHIRGKLRKKVWINTGDIILLGLRDYQVNFYSIFSSC